MPDHEKQDAFEIKDLKAMLCESPEFGQDKTREAHYFWIPLIALFTGARREEICQLYVTDLIKEQGVWCLDIQEESDNLLRLMARKHLELAMRNPTSTAHLVASKMAMFRRRYGDSVTHAQLALAFDANDPDTNLNMAWVLMSTGKPGEGLEFVNKTIQLDPRNMAAPFSAAGMAYFIMGDLKKAATMTERAIAGNFWHS